MLAQIVGLCGNLRSSPRVLTRNRAAAGRCGGFLCRSPQGSAMGFRCLERLTSRLMGCRPRALYGPLRRSQDATAGGPGANERFPPCERCRRTRRQDDQGQNPRGNQGEGTRGRCGLGGQAVHRRHRRPKREGRLDRAVRSGVCHRGGRRRFRYFPNRHPLVAAARAADHLARRKASGGDLVFGGASWAGNSHEDP
jgi:hypothetical protein